MLPIDDENYNGNLYSDSDFRRVEFWTLPNKIGATPHRLDNTQVWSARSQG